MTPVLYQQVYDRLRSSIEGGVFPVGERLPSESELTQQLGVSAITLKRALELLRDDGFIVRRPRLGTFVVSSVAVTERPRAAGGQPIAGCVLTDFDDTFGTRLLAGLLDAAEGSANLVVKRSLGDGAAEDAIIRSLVADGVRGLVLEPSSSEFVPPAILELVTQRFPVVILDRVFDGVPVSAVCSDNVAAGRRATEELLDLGHERIGLVTTATAVSTVTDRREGYIGAHAAAHVPHDPRDEFLAVRSTTPGTRTDPEADIAQLADFLSARSEVTAVVATEYNIAVLLREAARRIGRNVPDDLSIVCFDHPDAFYDASRFRFTHIRQDQERMGAEAVRLLVEQIEQPGTVRKLSIETTLVPGESTRHRG